jgi:homoserine dehydrogenase
MPDGIRKCGPGVCAPRGTQEKPVAKGLRRQLHYHRHRNRRPRSLDSLSKERTPRDIKEFIANSHADFLLENSPVSYKDGEPAVTHIRAALGNGMHAVSANKGPVAHAWQELSDLAKSKGKHFLFESTVMDGAPVFSVVRESMLSAEILGFEGILNSCTNLIIGQMEEGYTFDEAVEYAQSIGIAETDPSGDIDGWDAAIKVALLATVLMGEPIKPQQVAREGIRDLSATEAQQALKDGGRWKLVCRAKQEDGMFTARVAPEIVLPISPLYSVNGTSSIVIFHTDVLPGLGILESNPGPDTTAFGLLADILSILKNEE